MDAARLGGLQQAQGAGGQGQDEGPGTLAVGEHDDRQLVARQHDQRGIEWRREAVVPDHRIAGGGVRAVVEATGVSDVLSKSLGSDNILNVVQATFAALQEVKDFRVEAQRRGIDPKRTAPFWYREEIQNVHAG